MDVEGSNLKLTCVSLFAIQGKLVKVTVHTRVARAGGQNRLDEYLQYTRQNGERLRQ